MGLIYLYLFNDGLNLCWCYYCAGLVCTESEWVSCYVTCCFVMSRVVLLCHVLFCYVTCCFVMPRVVLLCHVLFCYVTFCFVISLLFCYVTCCFVMSRVVLLLLVVLLYHCCFVTLLVVLLYHVLFCYVTCFVMSRVVLLCWLECIVGWVHWSSVGYNERQRKGKVHRTPGQEGPELE